MIEIFDEPSADESERAVGPRVKRRERSQQRRRNHDALGRRRHVDNGAVDVEQDRDAGEVDWFQNRLPERRLDNGLHLHDHPENEAVTSISPRASRI